jgi:cellobiose-specific phosphotransferase system component IIC
MNQRIRRVRMHFAASPITRAVMTVTSVAALLATSVFTLLGTALLADRAYAQSAIAAAAMEPAAEARPVLVGGAGITLAVVVAILVIAGLTLAGLTRLAFRGVERGNEAMGAGRGRV